MTLKTELENKRKELAGTRAGSRFWEDYFAKETDIYKQILSKKENKIETTINSFSEEYDIEPYLIILFLEGIATSLDNDLGNLDNYTLESPLVLDINFEKLLYNMHLNKAPWLYGLKEWDGIFSKEKQKEIEDSYHYGRTVRKEEKPGRNDPCPCGSGKKYKNCHGRRRKVG